MKMQFFHVPTVAGDKAQDELNRFLSTHRIVSIDRQFVASGDKSHWAICVSYEEGIDRSTSSSRNRIDYREVLPKTYQYFGKD